ncbi:MAG: GTP-binding protein, partial [Betaproteobacteria bacterium]|nr:GTP-binding protein [Betaproteobacteria bacterium]
MAPGAATAARDALAGRIPVTVVTGFLGSGKTTLINRLLRHPGMNRVAVVINEFGEQAIDHDLVQASSEQMMLLDNGCLCCTLRSDLQETLHQLFVKRRNGEVIDFGRVVIETSGLADPAPVMQTLLTDTLLAAHYRLDGVVTLVDAVNGPGQLDAFGEPFKQTAVADRLIITKADLAEAADVERLRDRLHGINVRAAIAKAVDGQIAPAFLMDLGLNDTEARRAQIERWLGGEPGAQSETGCARHASGIESFCLWFDEPFAWEMFTQCMGVLAARGRSAAGKGPGERCRRGGTACRAGGAAPVPSAGAARGVAGCGAPFAHSIHHARDSARHHRQPVCRGGCGERPALTARAPRGGRTPDCGVVGQFGFA